MRLRALLFTAMWGSSSALAQPVPGPVPPVAGLSSKSWRLTLAQTLTAGAGPAQLGVSTGKRDERPRAANAVAVAGRNIWVVDGENGRMLKLGAAAPSIIKLEAARSLVDLVPLSEGVVGFNASSSKLMRIDKHGSVRELDLERVESFSSLVPIAGRSVLLKSGRKLLKVDLDEDETAPPPPPAPLAPLHPGAPIGHAPHLRRPMRIKASLAVKALRGAPISLERSIDVKLGQSKARVAFMVGDKEERSAELVAPVPGRLASTTLLGTDRTGRSFYRLEVLTSEEPIRVERFIQVLGPQGQKLELINLPTDGVIVPEKDIAISEDGAVVVLLPYETKTVVVRLDPP